MKVYIVTAGDYSYYHIEKVFTSPVMAQMYADLDDDRRVEEFPVDNVKIDSAQKLLVNVVYDFAEDKIESLTQVKYEWNAYDPKIGDDWCTTFKFSVLVTGRLFQDIAQHGMQSKLLLKIARDKFSAELDRHQTTKVLLLDRKRRQKEEYDLRYGRHPMCTTSSDTGNPFEKICTQEVADKLDEMYKNGEALPDAMTLIKMIRESRDKHDKDGVIDG